MTYIIDEYESSMKTADTFSTQLSNVPAGNWSNSNAVVVILLF